MQAELAACRDKKNDDGKVVNALQRKPQLAKNLPDKVKTESESFAKKEKIVASLTAVRGSGGKKSCELM